MEVYKVVRVDEKGRLKSALTRRATIRSGHAQAQLTYAQGKTTKPKLGKIFAFGLQGDAGSFVREQFYSRIKLKEIQIWLAEAPAAEHIYRIATDGSGHCLSRFKSFWEGTLSKEKTMIAPQGTVVCPEITLIRRVDNGSLQSSE